MFWTEGVAVYFSAATNRRSRGASWSIIAPPFIDYVSDIGYPGQSTHHLPNESMNVINQVNPKYLTLGSLLNDSIGSPAVIAAGYAPPYPGFTGNLAQALKAYPQYYSLTPQGDAVGNASYNALLVKAEKRFPNGFQYLVSYTWSRNAHR